MFIRLLSMCAVIAVMLFPVSAKSAEVTLHGSTTVSANLSLPHQSDIEAKSGQTLKIISNGSSNGIKGVNSGVADIGMISAPLEAVVAKVNKKEPGSVNLPELTAHQVGEAKVAFTVHNSNPVKEMTLEQVASVLKGETTNWSELGGNDAPIMVVTELSGGGLRSMVEGEILDKKPMSAPSMKEMTNATLIPKLVSQMPGAFGVMSAVLVDDSLTEVKTDAPIAQPLIYVTKGEVSSEVQAVIDASKEIGGM